MDGTENFKPKTVGARYLFSFPFSPPSLPPPLYLLRSETNETWMMTGWKSTVTEIMS